MKQTFFSPNDEKSRELIKTFIRYGYKGIVIKQWSSRPIACFVRGGPSARVELLARHISTKSQNWGTTFGMFRCFFGTEGSCTDPAKFRPRIAWQPQDHPCLLNPRNTLDRDCQHAPLSKASNKSLHEYDDRHITRARLQSGQRSREHPHESISETVE